MNFSQLQLLVAVAETASFTLAGDRVGMTQSAVSHALNNLEAELGVKLLERHRSGVAVTPIGQQVLYHAQNILNHVEGIRQETAYTRGVTMGKLRLGTFPSISARLLPDVLRKLTAQYPQIELVLFEGTDEEVVEWIERGVIDVGFVTAHGDSVQSVPLMDDEMCVVVPIQHPLSHHSTVTPAELAKYPFILSRSGCATIIRQIFHRANVALSPKFQVSDVSTILAMVQEGLGVTIVPEMIIPHEIDGLQRLHVEPIAYRHLSLGVKHLDTINPATRAFIELALQKAHALAKPIGTDR